MPETFFVLEHLARVTHANSGAYVGVSLVRRRFFWLEVHSAQQFTAEVQHATYSFACPPVTRDATNGWHDTRALVLRNFRQEEKPRLFRAQHTPHNFNDWPRPESQRPASAFHAPQHFRYAVVLVD
jgi:hypothetical protein